MIPIIQKNDSPGYRFCYFENAEGKFFADMIDYNFYIGVLVPLPRLLPIYFRIMQCDERWQFNEEIPPIRVKKGIYFNETELTNFIGEFLK